MADQTNQPLYGDFPSVSTQEWMEKVAEDLKGADFEKKLVWKTNEGFKVQPFYREEDLEQMKYLDSLPGEFPFVRGTKTTNKWLIRQDMVVNNAEAVNKKGLELLTKGVNSLGFIFENESLITKDSVEILLKNFPAEEAELNFSTTGNSEKLFQLVISELESNNQNSEKISGSLNFDPIGTLTITGKTKTSTESLMDEAAEIVLKAKKYPQFQAISVNGRYFGNAGSTIVQELGFSLSAANEYLSQLTQRGLSADEAAGNIRFNLSVGSNYFMEIAKLRAARLLWATIVEAYMPSEKETCKMIIHSETSEFNKTIYDPYVNMLRTQTEAMSATIGSCHSLTVHPFDKVFRNTGEFSERIARNQQLLLKEESYFGMITDPSAGSYYIESLTDSIAREAWNLFLTTEEKGGYLAALNSGIIQSQIKESASKFQQTLAQRKTVLLGTNQYPNASEKMLDSTERSNMKEPTPEKGEVEPLQQFRCADQFEALRLATEKATKPPKVFMLTYGNLAMRLARSQFSGNFFGCADYEIIDNLGFNTIEDGVEAALKASADIVVLCSSDEEYTEAAPLAYDKLGNKALLVIAGAPSCMDDLKAKGIKYFINIRSNVLETLKEFHQILNL